jgi:hypothetical protein
MAISWISVYQRARGQQEDGKIQTRPVGVSGVFFNYIVAVGVQHDRRTQK